jgi:uroporphyrinogen decarboxylase
MSMRKSERLEATIRGEPVDRVAVALWRHFPGDDQRAEDLAEATVAFQRRYDFDFIKVTPSSSFCVQDWGVETRWLGNEEGTREYTRRAINGPDDWRKLQPLDPRRGALGEQLRCLDLIQRQVGSEVPFIQTIFNPLSQAKNLAGPGFVADMRQHPDALRAGLEVITATTISFIAAAREAGVAGIFLALQQATYDLLGEEEYKTFGRPYDLRVLEAAQDLWFNVLHLHGEQVMFSLVADYPVQAINWHDRETWPSLQEALGLTDKALIGGIRRVETMRRGTPQEVQEEVADAIRQTGGRRYIVGTGCVTDIVSPTSNIRAARQAVENGHGR